MKESYSKCHRLPARQGSSALLAQFAHIWSCRPIIVLIVYFDTFFSNSDIFVGSFLENFTRIKAVDEVEKHKKCYFCAELSA